MSTVEARHKAARIALLVCLARSGCPVRREDTRKLAELCGVNMRAIQRDKLLVSWVQLRVDALLSVWRPEPTQGVTQLDKLFTTQQVSDLLGLHPGWINRLACRHGLGVRLNRNMRVFTVDDIERLKVRRRPGQALTMPIVGRFLDVAESLVRDGVIASLSEVKIVVRARRRGDKRHEVLAQFKNDDGKIVYFVRV